MTKYLLAHFESWLTNESIGNYLKIVSQFKEFNRIQNKQHLFKKYLQAPRVKLDESTSPDQKSLKSILETRRSITKFKSSEAELRDISNIFKLAFSISETKFLLTTSPSIGGLNSTEVYFVSLRVSGLKMGLYHYNVEDFCLEFLRPVDIRELQSIYIDNNLDFDNAVGLFFFTVKTDLAFKKYQFRAWRLLYLEVGHIMMNFWMSVQNQKFVGSSLGGGLDKQGNDFLKIDGVNECFVSSLIFGNGN